MNLNPIQANMTELDLGRGRLVLFSYRTPVALFDFSDGAGFGRYFRTEKRWSNTTSRHINKWLNGRPAEEKPQEFFDNLIAAVNS